MFKMFGTSYIVKGMDLILFPLLSINPALTIFIVAFLTTVFIIGVGRMLMDSKKVEEVKTRSKEIREKILNAQKLGNKAEMEKMVDELFKLNREFMKETVKTLGLSIVVAVLFLPWLSAHYSGMSVANLPISIPFVGNKLNWIYWYALVSFISGFVLTKLIGVSI